MKTLYDSLNDYQNTDYYPLHMPGHKRRSCYEEKNVLSQAYTIDITEIEGFDNLHHAEGILKSAQERVAKLYGADESFFLINGSTGGLLSAISSICENDKKVLISRCCHKAVYNALYINKVEAEYVWPSYIEEFDIQGEINPQEIKTVLDAYLEDSGQCGISAVVITSPTYDGVVSDIKQIAEIVHQYNIPLIVDEAHGAHFAFDKRFPQSAVLAGADIVINSTHKTLPAMTQTALLHVQGNLVNREKLKNYLQIYQTSSPSYVLMSSIDSCMDLLEREGERFFDKLFVLRQRIDEAAMQFGRIRIVPIEMAEAGKVVISVKNTNLSGQELYDVLLQRYHIQMEMAGYNYVVGILTAMDTEEGVSRLLNALTEIDKELEVCGEESVNEENKNNKKNLHYCCKTDSKYPPYAAMEMGKEWVSVEHALDKVSGMTVMLYPPGVPILVPGEMIDMHILEQISFAVSQNMNLIGLSENHKEICIIKE